MFSISKIICIDIDEVVPQPVQTSQQILQEIPAGNSEVIDTSDSVLGGMTDGESALNATETNEDESQILQDGNQIFQNDKANSTIFSIVEAINHGEADTNERFSVPVNYKESEFFTQTPRDHRYESNYFDYGQSQMYPMNDNTLDCSMRKGLSEMIRDKTLAKRFQKFMMFNYGKAPKDSKKLVFKSIARLKNRSHYIGQYIKGTSKRHGMGIEITENYSVYEGWWKNDMKHGLGRYIDADGTVYEGKWEYGISKGFGIYSNPQGLKCANLDWNDQGRLKLCFLYYVVCI